MAVTQYKLFHFTSKIIICLWRVLLVWKKIHFEECIYSNKVKLNGLIIIHVTLRYVWPLILGFWQFNRRWMPEKNLECMYFSNTNIIVSLQDRGMSILISCKRFPLLSVFSHYVQSLSSMVMHLIYAKYTHKFNAMPIKYPYSSHPYPTLSPLGSPHDAHMVPAAKIVWVQYGQPTWCP